MAQCSVQNIFDDVRGLLQDTQVVGGEVFTNNYLLGIQGSGVAGSGSYLGKPYRTLFSKIAGASDQVRPVVYVVLPANTTILIPSTYGILDFKAPIMLEERPATSTVAVASTDTSTPINVTTVNPHNLGTNGTVAEGTLSGTTVAGPPATPCTAPWGHWFATVTGTSTFSLNGSGSDGIAGTGGVWVPDSTTPYTEVFKTDLDDALDGQPQSVLGNYTWRSGRLQFRGSTNATELRITYIASGYAPTNPNYVIPIDDCRDFLGVATAADAARSRGWMSMYQELRNVAYGDPSHPEEDSLIDLFYRAQILSSQQGPARRQLPFRSRRYKFGSYMLG